MTNGTPPPAATTAAPAAAPSAPAASPASASNGTRLPPAGGFNGVPPPHPPSGAQQPPDSAAEAAAERAARYPWKTRAKVGDAEHEVEIDLAGYRHPVTIDGQKYELGIGDLTKNVERLRSSMKRYDEASKLKKDAEAALAQLEQEKRGIVQQLRNPQQAFALVKRALGAERYNEMLVAELKRQVDYERMPDDQRIAYDRQSQREEQLSRRQLELERREAAIKKQEEQRVARIQAEREKALLAEWIPALERAGLPAQANGEIVKMLARKIRWARERQIPLTLDDAIGEVREEYQSLVGYEVERRQKQTLAAIESQPGRADPDPRTAPSPPRRQPQQRISAAEFERNLRKTWQR